MYGAMASVVRNGQRFTRWQLKLNEKIGARIWYFVDGKTVVLEEVHTHHPNETK